MLRAIYVKFYWKNKYGEKKTHKSRSNQGQKRIYATKGIVYTTKMGVKQSIGGKLVCPFLQKNQLPTINFQ